MDLCVHRMSVCVCVQVYICVYVEVCTSGGHGTSLGVGPSTHLTPPPFCNKVSHQPGSLLLAGLPAQGICLRWDCECPHLMFYVTSEDTVLIQLLDFLPTPQPLRLRQDLMRYPH